MRIDFIVVFKKFCLFLDLSESTALLENDTENDTDSSAENDTENDEDTSAENDTEIDEDTGAENDTENDEDTGAENDTENDLSDLVRKKTLYSLRSKLYIP